VWGKNGTSEGSRSLEPTMVTCRSSCCDLCFHGRDWDREAKILGAKGKKRDYAGIVLVMCFEVGATSIGIRLSPNRQKILMEARWHKHKHKAKPESAIDLRSFSARRRPRVGEKFG
jgi:hypothetical protein